MCSGHFELAPSTQSPNIGALRIRIGLWGHYPTLTIRNQGTCNVGALIIRIGFWGHYTILIRPL